MVPVHFRGQHRVLEAPPEYDHRNGKVGEIVGLPVRFLIAYGDDGATIHLGYRSVWRPSPGELAALNAGGGIMLDVLNRFQPPVAVGVCPPEDVLVEA